MEFSTFMLNLLTLAAACRTSVTHRACETCSKKILYSGIPSCVEYLWVVVTHEKYVKIVCYYFEGLLVILFVLKFSNWKNVKYMTL